jgi:hypothetical protein
MSASSVDGTNDDTADHASPWPVPRKSRDKPVKPASSDSSGEPRAPRHKRSWAGARSVNTVAVGVDTLFVESTEARATSRPAGPVDATRAIIGLVALTSLAVGLLGWVSGVESLRAAGFIGFCLLGFGSAPWQVATLDVYTRLALTFITSVGVLTLGSLSMIGLHAWFPQLAFFAVAAVCVPFHVRAVSLYPARAPTTFLTQQWLRSWARVLPLPTLVASAGALVCLADAALHRHLQPGYYGFLTEVGPLWYAGLLLVLVAVCVGSGRESGRALPVFLLVLVLTATPALTYDGPRSQSAAKHLDFVIQIQTIHELTSSVPAYNAFAGFFAAVAWLCDIAGIRDPLGLAVAWPALLGLFRVAALRFLAGSFLRGPDQCWVAVTLAVLADSISADYFSPQSVGFVLGMCVFGVARSGDLGRWRLPVALLGGVTLAVTHQLSPYVVGGVLVVLVVFRQVHPWWSPGLVLVPAFVWTGLHWDAVRTFLDLDTLGRANNFRPPAVVAVTDLQRLPVVGHTVVALVVGILLLGLLAAVALWRQRRDASAWAMAFCPPVGLMIVAVNPYGQEGIFRTALFGIPWLALLASHLWRRPTVWSRALLGVTSLILASCFLVSSFGLDAFNVIRRGDLAAVRAFQADGGPRPPYPRYLLLLEPGDHPISPGEIGGSHLVWGRDRVDLPSAEANRLDTRREMQLLTRRLVDSTQQPTTHASLFALWSPAAADYGRAYALQTRAHSVQLLEAFREAPYWTVAGASEGTYLFHFRPADYREAP